MRLLSLRWLIPLTLVVLLLPACGDSADDDTGTTAAAEASTTTVADTQAPTTEVEQTSAEQTVAEVAGVEWPGFCSSEQNLFEFISDFRALEHSQLDYAELEVALAPGGVPTSDEAEDLLALLRAMAESWDDLGAAIEGATIDVDTDVDLSGYNLLVGNEGVILASFRYADDPGPFVFAEQEAIAFHEASRALADTAQLLGLGECSLLADKTEETEPATSE